MESYDQPVRPTRGSRCARNTRLSRELLWGPRDRFNFVENFPYGVAGQIEFIRNENRRAAMLTNCGLLKHQNIGQSRLYSSCELMSRATNGESSGANPLHDIIVPNRTRLAQSGRASYETSPVEVCQQPPDPIIACRHLIPSRVRIPLNGRCGCNDASRGSSLSLPVCRETEGWLTVQSPGLKPSG